jgi:hypothetical protein
MAWNLFKTIVSTETEPKALMGQPALAAAE